VGKPIINLSSVTTVGLDLAKHVFQVHGVDASGCVVVAKAIRRNKLLEFFASLPPCLVGLEAREMSRCLLKFSKRSLRIEIYAASAI
jgi:transposase